MPINDAAGETRWNLFGASKSLRHWGWSCFGHLFGHGSLFLAIKLRRTTTVQKNCLGASGWPGQRCGYHDDATFFVAPERFGIAIHCFRSSGWVPWEAWRQQLSDWNGPPIKAFVASRRDHCQPGLDSICRPVSNLGSVSLGREYDLTALPIFVPKTLTVMLVIVLIGMPVVLATNLVFPGFRGKVSHR